MLNASKYNLEQTEFESDTSHGRILKLIPNNSKVLELGCASGYMSQALKNKGCYVIGVEYDTELAKLARKQCDCLIQGDLDIIDLSQELQGEQFDVIIVADVLEHLRDPKRILEQIKYLLKQNAFVVGSVPNIAHISVSLALLKGDFDYRPLGILDEGHKRFFTRRSLEHMLEESGYRLDNVSRTNAAPYQIEITQPLYEFGPEVIRYVEQNSEATTYQFVFTAIPFSEQETYNKIQKEIKFLREEILKLEPSVLKTALQSAQAQIDTLNFEYQRIKNMVSHKQELQLYWDEHGNFNEQNSVKMPLVIDKNNHRYEITLEDRVKGLVRLDIGSQPLHVEISKIEVLSGTDSKDVLYVWSSDNNFEGINLINGMVKVNNGTTLCLLSTNEDPQLLLRNFPEPLNNGLRYLNIEMKIEPNLSESICSLVSKLEEEKTKTINLTTIVKSEGEQITRLEESKELFRNEIQQKNELILSLKEKIIEQREEISEQQLEINSLRQELKTHKQQLEQLPQDILSIKQQLDLKENLLADILGSQSWRFTAPLRWLGGRLKKTIENSCNFVELLIRRSYKQELIPVNNLVKTSQNHTYIWEANGNDPQFLLKGKYPKGWMLVNYSGVASKPLKLKLYIDRGNGFNENEFNEIGILDDSNVSINKAVVHLGPQVKMLRLDPGESSSTFSLSNISLVRISRFEILLRAFWSYWRINGVTAKSLKTILHKVWQKGRRVGIRGLWNYAKQAVSPNSISNTDDYNHWLEQNRLTEENIKEIKKHIKELSYCPTFSIIVPVYNVEEQWLRKCIQSVLDQLYPYWELCIADDASTKPHVREVLEEYSKLDKRIRVIYRNENGHISAASNSALELATGQFVALLDNDDELAPNALYENAILLNKHPDADMIYSDEDKITEEGVRYQPYFKPDWSPDTFMSSMYTCHLGVYRTELVREIDGFRIGFEGSQDYDLVLRLTEKTKNIYHIPKILYYWRTIAGSTAANPDSKGYAHLAGKKALEEALVRRGVDGWVETADDLPNRYRVHYNLSGNPLISVIIPTRDMASILSKCLDSIFQKTTYKNFELLVIDNGSQEEETNKLFEFWQNQEPKRFKVFRLDIPFNYSKLNNEAAKIANGELLLLLNNDTEVISPDWLQEMAGYATKDSIGAVGAKLFYPDDTIQHAGVVLGIGGVANHSHCGFSKDVPGYYGILSSTANYSAITGACLMVKKALYESVDGLDEELAVAFNDVDFCLRLHDKGYYNLVLPHVHLYHHESKSRGTDDSPEKKKRFNKENQIMMEKWSNVIKNDPFYNINLTRSRTDYNIGFI